MVNAFMAGRKIHTSEIPALMSRNHETTVLMLIRFETLQFMQYIS
jgi:hypothetical protein